MTRGVNPILPIPLESVQATHLDTRHLQRMDRLWDTLLELVLDSSRTKQEHIPLDKLRSVVERLPTSVDRRSRLVVDGRPLAVFRLGNIARSDTERPQTIRRIILQIDG